MCTFKLCDKFINVVSKWKNVKVETALFTVLPLGKEKHPAPDERDKMLCALKKLVHQLPPAHYSTLKYFMAHLKRVSAFSEQNKMVTRSVVISVIIVLLLLLLCIIIVIDNTVIIIVIVVVIICYLKCHYPWCGYHNIAIVVSSVLRACHLLSNLAMCVSPNLLRPEVETIEYSLNIPKANGALQVCRSSFALWGKGSS